MGEYDGLIERLSNPVEVDAGCYAERRTGDMQSAASAITDLQTRLAAVEKERDEARAWGERLRSYMSEGGYETIQSEQAWKRRAEAAEAALAAIRAAAKGE